MIRAFSLLSASLLLAASAFVHTQDRPALKDVFKDAFVMGTAVNDAIVSGRDAAARELVLRHFGSITVENAMKAGPITPGTS